MTFPVVWLPEADADLQEARAWYDNVRSELGGQDNALAADSNSVLARGYGSLRM
jgi:hypothetical protein